jgi:hypothetical protein
VYSAANFSTAGGLRCWPGSTRRGTPATSTVGNDAHLGRGVEAVVGALIPMR